jgi:hypothetical protein
LAVALLAAAVAHTPEAEEVLRGARMRMARKPSAVARELLRNFPKPGKRRRRRTRRNGEARNGEGGAPEREKLEPEAEDEEVADEPEADADEGSESEDSEDRSR